MKTEVRSGWGNGGGMRHTAKGRQKIVRVF